MALPRGVAGVDLRAPRTFHRSKKSDRARGRSRKTAASGAKDAARDGSGAPCVEMARQVLPFRLDAAATDERIATMNFVVQLLPEGRGNAGADAVRTIDFEADDLFSVVARMRIILGSSDYEPTAAAFQIMDGAHVVYHERRLQADAPRKAEARAPWRPDSDMRRRK